MWGLREIARSNGRSLAFLGSQVVASAALEGMEKLACRISKAFFSTFGVGRFAHALIEIQAAGTTAETRR
jgi:hypothetical protein